MLSTRKTFPLTLSSIISVIITEDGERAIPLLAKDSWNRDGQYLLPTEYHPFKGPLLMLVNLRRFDWRINIDCVILFWGSIYISQLSRLVIRPRFLIWGVRRAFGLLKWLQSSQRLRLLGLIFLLNRPDSPFPPIAPSRYIHLAFPPLLSLPLMATSPSLHCIIFDVFNYSLYSS